jgi:hypothetical protein
MLIGVSPPQIGLNRVFEHVEAYFEGISMLKKL